uniref:Uncharacterized protein n=1 Tax=Romanomermis culicivorax TaxID=13658 RepID=A0A915IAU1_ROMCU
MLQGTRHHASIIRKAYARLARLRAYTEQMHGQICPRSGLAPLGNLLGSDLSCQKSSHSLTFICRKTQELFRCILLHLKGTTIDYHCIWLTSSGFDSGYRMHYNLSHMRFPPENVPSGHTFILLEKRLTLGVKVNFVQQSLLFGFEIHLTTVAN